MKGDVGEVVKGFVGCLGFVVYGLIELELYLLLLYLDVNLGGLLDLLFIIGEKLFMVGE